MFSSIHSLYGIGSYFRGEQFNDIDLVAVVDCGYEQLARNAQVIHRAFRELGDGLGVPVDLTIFTESEFAAAPLRDMVDLKRIYFRA